MRVRNPYSLCQEVLGAPAAVAAEAVQGLPTCPVAREEQRVVEADPEPAATLALEVRAGIQKVLALRDQAVTPVVPGLQVPEDTLALVQLPVLVAPPALEAIPAEEAASPVGQVTPALVLDVLVRADTLHQEPVDLAQAAILELEATGPAQVLGQVLVGITANPEVDPVAPAPAAMAAQAALEVLVDMAVRVAPQDLEDQEALVVMVRAVLEDLEGQGALVVMARVVLEDPEDREDQEGPVAAMVRVVPEGLVGPEVLLGPKGQGGMVDPEDLEDLEDPADPRVQVLQEGPVVIRVQEAMVHPDLEVREPRLVVQGLT